jgi:hypothetical protein
MIDTTRGEAHLIETKGMLQGNVGTKSLSRSAAKQQHQQEDERSGEMVASGPTNLKNKLPENSDSIRKRSNRQGLLIQAQDEMLEGKPNIHYSDCYQEQENVKDESIPTSDQEKQGNKTSRINASTSRTTSSLTCSLACNAVLNFVGSIGSSVEHCMEEIFNGANHQPKYNNSDELLGMETFDTFEVQLMNDIQLYNRMNSWETNGTFTTVGTMNTEAGMDTNSILSSSNVSPRNSTIRDTENLSTNADKATSEKDAKIKSKKKQMKRVVNFQYPPISSMKECPRLTDEEKKKLFFTEEELDLYEEDRKQILCDDIEVIAVEFTGTEDNREHEDRCDRESERSEISGGPRMGGGDSKSKKSSKAASLRAAIDSKSSSDMKNVACSTSQEKKSPAKQRSKHDVFKSSNKRGNEGSGKAGKMKGVQIFLRQRSLG